MLGSKVLELDVNEWVILVVYHEGLLGRWESEEGGSEVILSIISLA